MTLFLSDLDFGRQTLIPVIAITLSLMIPIVAIIVDHFQKKAKLRLIEKAIEHGVDISELKFDTECTSGPRLPYRAGTVTLAVGIALVVGARYAPDGLSVLLYLATIGGAVCICVGIALLINDRVNRDRFDVPTDPGASGPVDLRR